jgi:hypothetical protein
MDSIFDTGFLIEVAKASIYKLSGYSILWLVYDIALRFSVSLILVNPGLLWIIIIILKLGSYVKLGYVVLSIFWPVS